MSQSEFLGKQAGTGYLRVGVEAVTTERLPNGVERRADVADDPDVDGIVRVDLGRETMDVDDLFVGLRFTQVDI